jgi:hypothetical protein
MKDNQHAKIWRYIDSHDAGITPMDAFIDLNITKLSTRVSEMIRMGYPIEKIPESRINAAGETVRYMRYRKAAA